MFTADVLRVIRFTIITMFLSDQKRFCVKQWRICAHFCMSKKMMTFIADSHFHNGQLRITHFWG